MTNENELRKGNWYLVNATGLTEESYSQFNDWQQWAGYIYDCSPIPITAEILEKAGFVPHEYLNCFYLESDADDFRIWYINNEYTFDKQYVIKFLHQLQNLTFALTGEELEINL